MRMTRRIWIQIAIFLIISTLAITYLAFSYIRVPALLGFGDYTVTVKLAEAGGLYERANVTYRGTEVGEVEKVNLTDTGVDAVLTLKSGVKIPSDLEADVHSTSAVGEQYIALLPRNSTSPPLKDGDTVTSANTTVPPDINALLDATNRGLQAIPQESLKTTVDEAYTAFGGLGPEISRFLKGGASLAGDAKANLNELTNVVDNVGPILDTQTVTSDSVQAWASHLADITTSLKDNDQALRGVLQKTPAAAEEARALFDRLNPTLPVVLANLVTLGQVAITYRADIEEILVLLPTGTSFAQAIGVPGRGLKGAYSSGQFLSFNLNLNLPPPCTTGFLPPQQIRGQSLEDYPDPPAGTLYCRIPQDSPNNVRGARNIPCETKPGKRAALASVCESDEQYVPLNDGSNWKGDPNATYTGQGVPEFGPGESVPPGYSSNAPPPAAVPPAGAPQQTVVPPIATVPYDPATGTYVGPDGRPYTQADLATQPTKGQDVAINAGTAGHTVSRDDVVAENGGMTTDLNQDVTRNEAENAGSGDVGDLDAGVTSSAENLDAQDAEDLAEVDTEAGRSGRDSLSTSLRVPALVGVLMLIALTGLAAYLGVRAYQAHQVIQERDQLLEVARQGALNLTTIDWQHADSDIQRILGSATGEFRDDFEQRSKPFVQVLEQTQSKSVGTITEAGLESSSGNEVQALVAVSVTTTDAVATQQAPRNWRMRVTVQKDGADAKVSNVEFVP